LELHPEAPEARLGCPKTELAAAPLGNPRAWLNAITRLQLKSETKRTPVKGSTQSPDGEPKVVAVQTKVLLIPKNPLLAGLIPAACALLNR